MKTANDHKVIVYLVKIEVLGFKLTKEKKTIYPDTDGRLGEEEERPNDYCAVAYNQLITFFHTENDK